MHAGFDKRQLYDLRASHEADDANTQKLVDLMKNSGPATNKTGFLCNKAPRGAEYASYHGTDCSADEDLSGLYAAMLED